MVIHSPSWDHCWNAWEHNLGTSWVWTTSIRACVTPGQSPCAARLHSGLPRAASRRVGSGRGPPWTQSHTLPRRGAGPAPCYHDCRAPLPGWEMGHTQTHTPVWSCTAHTNVMQQKWIRKGPPKIWEKRSDVLNQLFKPDAPESANRFTCDGAVLVKGYLEVLQHCLSKEYLNRGLKSNQWEANLWKRFFRHF